MKTLLATLNPQGIVGMAPFYLKSYYQTKWDPDGQHEIPIKGYDVALPIEPVVEDICAEAPDVLGFSCYVWNIEKVHELCREIRQRLPETRIVLGGPEISSNAHKIMRGNPVVDLAVVGEGEITFSEILNYFSNGEGELVDVKGIIYRKDQTTCATPPRPVVKDLDEIPSPFLTGTVDFEKLKGYLYGYETFRGCPYSCSFCYWGRTQKVRYFNMERIHKELAIILNSTLKRVWLGDAVANLHRKRFKEFLKGVIQNNTNTIIDFEMVADLLDDETIELLGQLNDGYVAFGLQSINDLALARMNRKWNREKFTRNVSALRQRTDKIKIYIDLIYGLPGDNLASYVAGIKFAMSLLPQKIQPHPLLVLPGSTYYENPDAYGFVFEGKAPHPVRECDTFSSEEMITAAKWKTKLFFYFNPAVNTTIIMLSQILDEDPFDLFGRLYALVTQSLDPTFVYSDIGIAEEHATTLTEMLHQFIDASLTGEDRDKYLGPLTDVIAFLGIKTMYHTGDRTNPDTERDEGDEDKVYPMLRRNVVVKKFSHDMGALYRGNLLRSPLELLRFEPKTYWVVFNLRTHCVYHISQGVSDILDSCREGRSLNMVVDQFVRARASSPSPGHYSAVRETIYDLAKKKVVVLLSS